MCPIGPHVQHVCGLWLRILYPGNSEKWFMRHVSDQPQILDSCSQDFRRRFPIYSNHLFRRKGSANAMTIIVLALGLMITNNHKQQSSRLE